MAVLSLCITFISPQNTHAKIPVAFWRNVASLKYDDPGILGNFPRKPGIKPGLIHAGGMVRDVFHGWYQTSLRDPDIADLLSCYFKTKSWAWMKIVFQEKWLDPTLGRYRVATLEFIIDRRGKVLAEREDGVLPQGYQ